MCTTDNQEADNQKADKAIYQRFQERGERNIPFSDPLLCEHAEMPNPKEEEDSNNSRSSDVSKAAKMSHNLQQFLPSHNDAPDNIISSCENINDFIECLVVS